MRIYFLFSIFLLSPVSFAEDSSVVKDSYFTQGSYRTPPPVYKCQMDEECLDHLDNVLLDKEVDRGIYQYCQITYEEIKDCCINPSECQESWAEGATQDLKDSSLSLAKTGEGALSCELNRLSHLTNSLSGFQAEMCEKGVNNCKIDCENKLREVRQTFRECFLIPEDSTIEEILKKAENPPTGEEACYKRMKESAEKYKSQSLNQDSSLREDLKAKDIVQCEDIKKEKTRASLNDFALNICQIAKNQEEEKRQAEEAKIQAEEERRQAEEAKRQEEENKRIEEARLAEEESARQNLAKSAEGDSGSQSRNQQDEAKTASSARAEKSGANTTNQAQNQSSSENSKNQASSSKASALLGAGAVAALGGGEDSPKAESSPSQTSSSNQAVTRSSQKNSSNSEIRDHFDSSDGEKNSSSNNCSAPEIQSAIVYQSVEAPQIEPLKWQEFQSDPDNPEFYSYDLVRGKSAGVLIKINKKDCWNDNKMFDLKMYLKNKPVENLECLPGDILSRHSLSLKLNQFCFFSSNDFKKNKGSLSKFIILPMDYGGALEFKGMDIPVKIDIIEKSKQSLVSFETFRVNVINTESLSISLIPMVENCPSDQIKNVNTTASTKEILSSEMVTEHLPYIFPLGEVSDLSLLIDLFRAKHFLYGVNTKFFYGEDFVISKNKEIKMRSRCKRLKVRNTKIVSRGMMSNVMALGNILGESNRDRIIGVVSKDYMTQHLDEDTCGFVPDLPVNWYEFSKVGLIVDKGKIVERNGVEIDTCEGTLLHELAHTMGQKKEFYKYPNKTCKQYRNNEDSIECYAYREKRGLRSSFKRSSFSGQEFFYWEENKYSIMNSRGFSKSWIDRETYQKAFRFLKDQPPVLPLNIHPITGELLPPEDPEERPGVKWIIPQIKMSGIYDKKSEQFIHFKRNLIFSPNSSPEFNRSLYKKIKRDFKYIEFKLVKKVDGKTKGKPYIVIVPQDMAFRVFYGNKRGKRVRFARTPFLASLPIKGTGDFELTISTGVLFKNGTKKRTKTIKRFKFKYPNKSVAVS